MSTCTGRASPGSPPWKGPKLTATNTLSHMQKAGRGKNLEEAGSAFSPSWSLGVWSLGVWSQAGLAFVCCCRWREVGEGVCAQEEETEVYLSTAFLLKGHPGSPPTPSSPQTPAHPQGPSQKPESIPGLHWETQRFLSDNVHSSVKGLDIM